MQETVHLKNILGNRPSADVYLVAKAKVTNLIVLKCGKSKDLESTLKLDSKTLLITA